MVIEIGKHSQIHEFSFFLYQIVRDSLLLFSSTNNNTSWQMYPQLHTHTLVRNMHENSGKEHGNTYQKFKNVPTQ